jgi:hypothetical protein
MVCCSFMMLVEFLEVLYKIVYSLGIKELYLSVEKMATMRGSSYLANDLRWLSAIYSLEVLLHCTIEVALLI